MSPSTSRDTLQATINKDHSFSLIDTFNNNRRTFFAVFSRISRKAFAFTANAVAVILTWIAVSPIGYNYQKAALLGTKKGRLIRSLPRLCIRHSKYIKWKCGYRSIPTPLLTVSRFRSPAHAYKLLFLLQLSSFWIMLSLFFFSFFCTRQILFKQRLQYLPKIMCFSLYIYFIVRYKCDLSIIIINAKQTVVKLAGNLVLTTGLKT